MLESVGLGQVQLFGQSDVLLDASFFAIPVQTHFWLPFEILPERVMCGGDTYIHTYIKSCLFCYLLLEQVTTSRGAG